MRALGFEPKREEIKKMIADVDKDDSPRRPSTFSTPMVLATSTRKNLRSPCVPS